MISDKKKDKISPGDIISYPTLCLIEGFSIQRGMNYKVKNGATVILMSVRVGSPYSDRIEEDGNVLIYEGHDAPKNWTKTPKIVDQPRVSPKGTLTENGKFERAVNDYKAGTRQPEKIRVYEKIKDGIWSYNGTFDLVDCWTERDEYRSVFKFKLRITLESEEERETNRNLSDDLDHNRIIPTAVKLAVWKRDKGMCIQCGSKDNLHFDHILPFSKGGTSLKVENIQLLCARHNLMKSDKIN
jgi:SAD/SRA domain/HNH endonuclease